MNDEELETTALMMRLYTFCSISQLPTDNLCISSTEGILTDPAPDTIETNLQVPLPGS